MYQLLDRNTSTRLGAREGAIELKRHPFFEGIDWDEVMRKGLTPPYIPRLAEEKPDADAPTLEPAKPKHRRNRSVDAFQGFSFTRQEGGQNAGPYDKKVLKKFDIPKMKRNKNMKKQNIATSTGARSSSTDAGEKSEGLLSKKRGHRRTRSQCAPSASTIDDIDLNANTDTKTESKKPKLGRLASVKLLQRRNKND